MSCLLLAVGNANAFPTGFNGQTRKTGGGGGGGHRPEPDFIVVIGGGPAILAAAASANYTVTSTYSSMTSGLKMGVDIAASDSPSPLTFAATNLRASGEEIVHTNATTPLKSMWPPPLVFYWAMSMDRGALTPPMYRR